MMSIRRSADPLSLMAQRLATNARGVALIEFAFVLPVLFLIYIGSFQLCDAIAAQRQLALTTRAISDMTTQNVDVTDATLGNILGASTMTMSPYPASSMTATISQIYIDPTGVAKVTWSKGYNTTSLPKNNIYHLTSGVYANNTYIIIATTHYDYVPNMSGSYLGTIPMNDSVVMFARDSASINCADCTN